MKKTPVRGRRPGPSDTRERILAVAREAFLAGGYQAVSLRAIATAAEVDVALLSYHFGSKQGLFSAAMSLPVNPADVLRPALEGDLDGLPERVLRGMMRAWEDPVSGPPLRAVAGAAASEPQLNRLVREAVGATLIDLLIERIGPVKAAIFSTQIAGVIFTRYLLRLEPIASMPAEDVVTHLLPALRATIMTG
jgi:AcrR family transcriptional regulator